MEKLIKYKQKFENLKYKDWIILIALFLIALVLRFYLINTNLFFGPEQGRDLLVVRDIVLSHKIVLIGPRTAVDGIFHGPFYYYLAVIPFLISKGNPVFIAYFFIFINSLSVFFGYLLGKELFNKRVGLITAFLFTFSFGAIAISRWLSHPPLIIPLSCLFFLFLAKFIKGKNNYLILTALLFGLCGQIEFTNYLLFGFILLSVLIIFRKRIKEQKPILLLVSLSVFIFSSISNYILFDVRHDFLISKGFIKLFTKESGYYGTFVNSIASSIDNFVKIANDTIFPLHSIPAVLIVFLGLFFVIKTEKEKIGKFFILIWLMAPFFVFTLIKYNALYHYFAFIIIGLLIVFAVLIDRIFINKKNVAFGLLIIFTIVNLFTWYTYLPTNYRVFFQSTQPDLKYRDQEMVVKEIYKIANGKPFYFQAYTIPYWLQQEWEYLFWYYGKNVYGYLPVHTNKGTLFVIIQDDPSSKQFQNDWLKYTVSKWGKEEGTFRYGALEVKKLIVE